MLGEIESMATVAVKDIAVARAFYEGTLGLEKIGSEGSNVVVYKTGSSKLLVYQSEFAGTNKATSATFSVGNANLQRVIDALESKGVTFEHYDMPGVKREGHVHIAGNMKAAWFKDPDGNIVNLAGG